jgi:hypothetical protein
LTEAIRAHVLHRAEGLGFGFGRRPDQELTKRVERAVAAAQSCAALSGTELDVDRAGDSKVALARIGDTFAYAQGVHDVADQKSEVRVALAVNVRGQIDRQATHTKSDVLAVFRIEAAQHVVVRDRRSFAATDVQAWCGAEDLSAFAAWGCGENIAVELEVADAARGAFAALTEHCYVDHAFGVGLGCRCWLRRRNGCARRFGAWQCERHWNADATHDRRVAAARGLEAPRLDGCGRRRIEARAGRARDLGRCDAAIPRHRHEQLDASFAPLAERIGRILCVDAVYCDGWCHGRRFGLRRGGRSRLLRRHAAANAREHQRAAEAKEP